MSPEETLEKLADLKADYAAAEEIAKKCETYFGEAVIPAFNELRYAGFHSLQAADAARLGDGGKTDEQLGKAASHCHRARYDAAEAGVVCCIEAFNQFRADYDLIPITDIVANYPHSMSAFRDAKALIATARRDDETREEYAERCEKLFDQLYAILQGLNDHREELNKRVRSTKEEEARREASRQRWQLATGIAVWGAIVSTIALGFSLGAG